MKKVRGGASVIVYDRNQPIARIERIETDERDGEVVARLERVALLRRAHAPLPLGLLRVDTPVTERSVVEALLEDRRTGR
jgi:hypothetical protein